MIRLKKQAAGRTVRVKNEDIPITIHCLGPELEEHKLILTNALVRATEFKEPHETSRCPPEPRVSQVGHSLSLWVSTAPYREHTRVNTDLFRRVRRARRCQAPCMTLLLWELRRGRPELCAALQVAGPAPGPH